MSSEEARAALERLTDLCTEVGVCRQQLLDQLGEATAEQVVRLLSSCEVDAGTLLAAAAANASRWPAEVLGALVAAARAQGESWDDIGRCFGVSRQAAHQRFACYDARLRPVVTDFLTACPQRPRNDEQAVSRLLDALAAAATEPGRRGNPPRPL